MSSFENFEWYAFTFLANHLDGILLGNLGLLVEDWFGLTTPTTLLTIITSLTLTEEGVFAFLINRAFMRSMLSLAETEVFTFFRIVYHYTQKKWCENAIDIFKCMKFSLLSTNLLIDEITTTRFWTRNPIFFIVFS